MERVLLVSFPCHLIEKGLWIISSLKDDPLITAVGSSNYGKRSESLDLECQCYILTSNPGLKQRVMQV